MSDSTLFPTLGLILAESQKIFPVERTHGVPHDHLDRITADVSAASSRLNQYMEAHKQSLGQSAMESLTVGHVFHLRNTINSGDVNPVWTSEMTGSKLLESTRGHRQRAIEHINTIDKFCQTLKLDRDRLENVVLGRSKGSIAVSAQETIDNRQTNSIRLLGHELDGVDDTNSTAKMDDKDLMWSSSCLQSNESYRKLSEVLPHILQRSLLCTRVQLNMDREALVKELSNQTTVQSDGGSITFKDVQEELQNAARNFSRITEAIQQKKAAVEAVLWHPCAQVQAEWTRLVQKEAKLAHDTRQAIYRARASMVSDHPASARVKLLLQTRQQDWLSVITHLKDLDRSVSSQTSTKDHAGELEVMGLPC